MRASRLEGVDWYVYTSTVGVYQPKRFSKKMMYGQPIQVKTINMPVG